MNTEIVLSSVNIRSLRRNKDILLKEADNLSKNLIAVQETWLESNEDIQFKMPSLELTLNNAGCGIGIAAFYSADYKNNCNISVKEYQISLYLSEKNAIINVYRSQNGSFSNLSKDLCRVLSSIPPESETFVVGDFNFCYSMDDNLVKKTLIDLKFKQIVKEATHQAGHLIDHVYVKNARFNYIIKHQSVPFLDHDIIHVVT